MVLGVSGTVVYGEVAVDLARPTHTQRHRVRRVVTVLHCVCMHGGDVDVAHLSSM